ncbi:MAG: WD40 repeat domain-containing protein [Xanthobacteraceae bacterium]
MPEITRRTLTFCLALGGVGAGAANARETRGDPASVTSIKLSRELNLSTRGVATAVAWSPDGSRLAAASAYGEDLTVWDNSGSVVNRIKRIGGGLYVDNSLAFVSGPSELLFPAPQTADATACADVWDVATGRIVNSVPGPAPEVNDYARNRARHFVVSPDQTIAAAAPNVGGYIAIYETNNWKRTKILKIESGVETLGFFPDGQRLSIGSILLGHFLIADISSAQITADFVLYASKFAHISIGTVAVSPNADFVLTGIGTVTIPGEYYRSAEARTWDQAVRPPVSIWRIKDGSYVTGLRNVQLPIRQAVWDPKNRFVAFVDNAATLFVWEPQAPQVAPTQISLPGSTLSLAISHSGSHLAVANGNGIRVYQID